MTEELKNELKDYLKQNLRIKGDFNSSDCAGDSINVQVFLEDELITEESIWLY